MTGMFYFLSREAGNPPPIPACHHHPQQSMATLSPPRSRAWLWLIDLLGLFQLLRKEEQGWVSGLYPEQALRFRPLSSLVTAQNIIPALRQLGGSEPFIGKAIFVNDPISFLGKKSRHLTTSTPTMTPFSTNRCKEQMP